MTDSNTHQNIITVFQKESNNSFKAVDKFLSDNSIDLSDISTIEKAISKHQKEIDKIVLPKKTGETLESKGYNPITRNTGYNTVNTYERGIKQVEVNKLKAYIKKHRYSIYLLNLLSRIIERFTPEGTTQAGGSKNKNQYQKKRDTTPKKNIFIELFIKKSFTKVYSKNSQKIIAVDIEISEASVSRFLKDLKILQEIEKKMKLIYSNNIDDSNFPLNYKFICDRITEAKQKKILPEYLESKKQEKQLDKDIKRGSKFQSINDLTEKELNEDTNRSYKTDEDD